MPHRQDTQLTSSSWEEALRQSGVLGILADFDPHVVGTLPLGISVPGSDIDVVCCAPDAHTFSEMLWQHLRAETAFSMHQWVGTPRPVVATFLYGGWPFEIFGADQPVGDQPGWRHFMAEGRLLAFGPSSFADAILQERACGMKTEAAFAKVLGLDGDPYTSLYELFSAPDHVLLTMLSTAGHAPMHGT